MHKAKLIELKGEIDKSTMIAGDFDTPQFEQVDKMISNDTEDFGNTII